VRAAEDWIRKRLDGAPPALLEKMVAALPERADDVAGALAAGALRLYEQVLGSGSGREVALPLLAADALMTHALEARAEADIDSVAGFAAEWGAAGRIRALAGVGHE
jgi:hypothetical protein